MVLNKRKKDEDEILDTGVNNYPNLGSKDTVKKLAEDYANFNYDTFTEGDSYKALEKRYQTGGQKAMQDTVGQVSARTGGLASSYATVAGQQTYNDWMGNLESAARALYDSEKQEMGDRYALANSMYLQERDEQRYAEELAYNRGRDQLADDRYIEERDYDRAWNEDEREYNRSENERLEGESDAIATIEEMIAAGVPVEDIDSELIAKSGFDSTHWEAVAKNKASADADETIIQMMENGTPLEEIPEDLIKASSKSYANWAAVDVKYAQERQADADAEAAAEIATAEASAANDVIMYLVGGTKTLDELEASGMLASTGQNRDWWEGYIAYRNKINPQEVEKVAKEFYEVDYDTVEGYMAYMDNITTQNEAINFKELVANATGNQGFADELYMRWLTMHSDIAVS